MELRSQVLTKPKAESPLTELGRTLEDFKCWGCIEISHTLLLMCPSIAAADAVFGVWGRAYAKRMMSSRVKGWNVSGTQAWSSAAL